MFTGALSVSMYFNLPHNLLTVIAIISQGITAFSTVVLLGFCSPGIRWQTTMISKRTASSRDLDRDAKVVVHEESSVMRSVHDVVPVFD